MAGFKRLHRGLLLLALILAGGLPARGLAAQVTYRPDVPVRGSSTVEYYKDATGRLDLAGATAPSTRYLPAPGKTVNFGFSSAAYWLHWSLHSQSTQPTTVYLSLAQPVLDEVQLYVLHRGVLQQSVRAGDTLPDRQHAIPATHAVLPVQIAPGGDYELYLRVAGRMGALLVPMQFQSAAGVERSARAELLLNGIFTGVFGALFVYNLLLLCSLRQRAYFYYVLLLPAGYLACTALDGFGAWMLYPSAVWPANQGLTVFAGSGFLLNMLFARALLETAGILWLDRLLLGVASIGLISALS